MKVQYSVIPNPDAQEPGQFEGAAVGQRANDFAPRGPTRSAVNDGSAQVFGELLTDMQAAAWFGISVRKFHALRAEPWLPKPIVLGPRLLRWSRRELVSALAAMPRQTEAEQPAQLLRARIDRAKRTGDLS